MITATNLDNVERYQSQRSAPPFRAVFDEGKTTATLKRRSMDLTNALADLRSSNR